MIQFQPGNLWVEKLVGSDIGSKYFSLREELDVFSLSFIRKQYSVG